MLLTRLLFSGILIGSATFGSLALAEDTFAPQLPPGCSKEVSAQLTQGKTFHGAKCNSPTCLCSAFLCTNKLHRTIYEQAKCQAAPA
jgi:hypothetical protein